MNYRMQLALALAFAVALGGCAQTRMPTGYAELAAAQGAANAQPGARKSPAHVSPVPVQDVSPQMQALIGAPYPGHFDADPKNAAEWKELINRRAAPTIAAPVASRTRLRRRKISLV